MARAKVHIQMDYYCDSSQQHARPTTYVPASKAAPRWQFMQCMPYGALTIWRKNGYSCSLTLIMHLTSKTGLFCCGTSGTSAHQGGSSFLIHTHTGPHSSYERMMTDDTGATSKYMCIHAMFLRLTKLAPLLG
jgi:hypothetical protein